MATRERNWRGDLGDDWFAESRNEPVINPYSDYRDWNASPIPTSAPDPVFDRNPALDRENPAADMPNPVRTQPDDNQGGGGNQGDNKSQWDKDFEEFKKIWEAITGLATLPDFAKTFEEAFGKLPGLDIGSFDDASKRILQGTDYRGLQEEAMNTLDANLGAVQAIASARGIGRSGMTDTRGRSVTSQVLGALARDINADKLQRANLLGNLQTNMWGLQAGDLASRRNQAGDVWRTLFGGALAQQGSALDVWRTLLASKSNQAAAQSQQQGGMLGSFLSFLGTILGGLLGAGKLFSDEKLKDVHGSGTKQADAFMDVLRPMVYNYKGDGRERLGIIAQDVEKVRPDLVVETPVGKALDVSQTTGTLLASLARLNERVKKLEGKYNG